MIINLFLQRLRPAICSMTWWRYWAKRARLLPQLLTLFTRLQLLRLRGASIGTMTIISPSEIVGTVANLVVGSECTLGRLMIQLHDRVEIGDRVVINDGVRLLTGTHNTQSAEWELLTRPIRIADYAWIATNAVILPGVEVGRGAVVAAGAVVSKPVPPLQIVAGNPARQVGIRGTSEFSYEPTRLVALFEAWLGRPNQ